MSENSYEDFTEGRRNMAAEIMLILAAGASKSDLAHIVQSCVRHVWDPENYPYVPLPKGVANAIIDYGNDLDQRTTEAVLARVQVEERRGFGSRGIIVSPEPNPPPEPNAAIEGGDVDQLDGTDEPA